MTLTELVQLGVAFGVSSTGVGGAAVLAVRLIAPHIVKMREAKVALLQEQAKADTARATAARAEAEAKRTNAEVDAAQTEIVAGALESMRRMRDEHTHELKQVRDEIRECQRRHSLAREALHAMKMWAQLVVYEMRKRNMTPPDMPAVVAEMEDV
jgi:chromosome segregation ATPase